MEDTRIDKTKKMRQFLLHQVDGLSAEQLNKIPVRMNNNIIWNLAHLIAIQQGLCYIRAAQSPVIPEPYFLPFITGTKPNVIIDDEKIKIIKDYFISTIDRLAADHEQQKFQEYSGSPNVYKVYGIAIKNIDDALEFLLYHEGYHTGCILNLIKLVT